MLGQIPGKKKDDALVANFVTIMREIGYESITGCRYEGEVTWWKFKFRFKFRRKALPLPSVLTVLDVLAKESERDKREMEKSQRKRR